MANKAIDITGQRFGRLVALKDVGSYRASRLWEFRCDCGGITQKRASEVKFGVVRSCGCLKRESLNNRLKPLDGQRFGRLTVLRRAEVNKHQKILWECLCDCGTTKKIDGACLVKNVIRSCGCLRRECARKHIAEVNKKDVYISKTAEWRKEVRARRRSRPEKAMAERLSRMLSHVLAGIGVIKRGRTFDMLGYTPDQLRSHIERQFVRRMSWENRAEWQLDHIIPLNTATTEDDVIALNQLSNLRPLWKKDNNQKHGRRLHLV